MPGALGFDTLAYAKKLKDAGVPEAQAEVHAEALADIIDERLSTKKDLKELEVTLRHEIKELEMRLKHDLTIRLGVMMTAGIVIVATLVKLL